MKPLNEGLVTSGCNILPVIDIPMFQISDLAVAVENAPEEVKKAAGYIIGPHDTDAVAKYLYSDYYGKPSVTVD